MLWAVWAASLAVSGCVLRQPPSTTGVDEFAALVRSTVNTYGSQNQTRSRRHTWGNEAAHEGTPCFFCFLSWPVPLLFMMRLGFDYPKTLGLFDGDIKLLNTLTANQETWVVIHELLHWAAFGSTGAPTTQTQQLYLDEMENVVGQIAFDPDTVHWDETQMPGTHRASGLAGSAELMTPQVDNMPFLAAATLNELRGSQIVGQRWCAASQPLLCGFPAPKSAAFFRASAWQTVPTAVGKLSIPMEGAAVSTHSPDVSLNDGEVTDDQALAIVLGSLGGVALLAGTVWVALGVAGTRARDSTLPRLSRTDGVALFGRRVTLALAVGAAAAARSVGKGGLLLLLLLGRGLGGLALGQLVHRPLVARLAHRHDRLERRGRRCSCRQTRAGRTPRCRASPCGPRRPSGES